MGSIRDDEEKIFVSLRLRPLNRKEILSNAVSDWECINNDTVVYKNIGCSGVIAPREQSTSREL